MPSYCISAFSSSISAYLPGQVRITGSTFNGNSALVAGGVFLGAGDNVVQGCTIANNAAEDSGGGLLANGITLLDSSIYGNVARTGSGGGLDLVGSTTNVLRNCTVSGNSAPGLAPGGAYYSGFAGGIAVTHLQTGSLTIQNCTVVRNSALQYGGGIEVSGSTTWNMNPTGPIKPWGLGPAGPFAGAGRDWR